MNPRIRHQHYTPTRLHLFHTHTLAERMVCKIEGLQLLGFAFVVPISVFLARIEQKLEYFGMVVRLYDLLVLSLRHNRIHLVSQSTYEEGVLCLA